jgi:hypothetical protein
VCGERIGLDLAADAPGADGGQALDVLVAEDGAGEPASDLGLGKAPMEPDGAPQTLAPDRRKTQELPGSRRDGLLGPAFGLGDAVSEPGPAVAGLEPGERIGIAQGLEGGEKEVGHGFLETAEGPHQVEHVDQDLGAPGHGASIRRRGGMG